MSDAIALKVDGDGERFKNQKGTYGCLKEWPQEGKVTGSLEAVGGGLCNCKLPVKKNCPAKRLATPMNNANTYWHIKSQAAALCVTMYNVIYG